MAEPSDVTALLASLASGRREAINELMPLVYEELRRLARLRRARWNDWEAPGTTSLVHEAYMKMVDQPRASFDGRQHFFYFASVAMRNLLIDQARYLGRQKREGVQVNEPLETLPVLTPERGEELLIMNEALERLEAADERMARIVECRAFGGLTIEETAEALGLSPATVKRVWNAARAWLYKEMSKQLQ